MDKVHRKRGAHRPQIVYRYNLFCLVYTNLRFVVGDVPSSAYLVHHSLSDGPAFTNKASMQEPRIRGCGIPSPRRALMQGSTENTVRAINRKSCGTNGDSGPSQIVVLDARLTMAGNEALRL